MSEERTTATREGVERLRRELSDAVDLIRRSGGGVVFEPFPGALQEEPPPAERVDARRALAAPDADAAACRALIDAAEELAEMLARARPDGREHPAAATGVGVVVRSRRARVAGPRAHHARRGGPDPALAGSFADAELVRAHLFRADVNRPKRIDGYIDYFGNSGIRPASPAGGRG